MKKISIENATISLPSLLGLISVVVAGTFAVSTLFHASEKNSSDIIELKQEISTSLQSIKNTLKETDGNVRVIEKELATIANTIEILVDVKKADLGINLQ